MDYKLEKEFGDQVIDNAKKMLIDQGDKVQFKLKFVALSSTEDSVVKKNLKERGVLEIYSKPNKMSNIESMIRIANSELSLIHI